MDGSGNLLKNEDVKITDEVKEDYKNNKTFNKYDKKKNNYYDYDEANYYKAKNKRGGDKFKKNK